MPQNVQALKNLIIVFWTTDCQFKYNFLLSKWHNFFIKLQDPLNLNEFQ